MKFATTVITLFAVLVGAAAQAQSLEQILRAAINTDGHACADVTATNPIAATSSGGAVIGVACSGGEQYAVEVSADAAIKSVTRCSTFESVTGASCF